MIRNLATTLAFATVIAAVSTAWSAEVTLPTTLNFLVDDPNDPADDADAFVLSPTGRFRFSDFTFSPVGTSLTPPGDTNILVTISETPTNVNVGFELQANGTATGPGAYELALEYLAEVVDPNFSFVSHTLSMEGATQGDGRIFINEEILSSGGGGIGTVSTFANVPNLMDQFSETINFFPTQMMTIHNKDISVAGVASGSSATLMRIDQSFGVIPEPSSLVLAALGALGLGLASRRFHRT